MQLELPMRHHWEHCLVHLDDKVASFIQEYFGRSDRHCLLVAGAGFDPRSVKVAAMMSGAMGGRLSAFVIREERGNPDTTLLRRADQSEAVLRRLIADIQVAPIDVFASDGAVIAGQRIVQALQKVSFPSQLTDIVIDVSAMSIGVSYPASAFLLQLCEKMGQKVNFHLMIASDPELDARIYGEPAERISIVKGYDGNYGQTGDDPVAAIWLPQLSHRCGTALTKLSVDDEYYNICPILPFPSRDPRRVDDLLNEYVPELHQAWDVGPRDLIFASEKNPVDMYRTLSVLKKRYDKTVSGIYTPQMVVSPLGSKVMATGAMMAAIEHKLTVKYVEALRYEFESAPAGAVEQGDLDLLVHVWLHGSVYGGLSA
jgi:hypothetical protein